jgi:hypothetical protein
VQREAAFDLTARWAQVVRAIGRILKPASE